MRLFKRLPVFVCTAVMSLGLVACGGSDDGGGVIEQPPVDPTGTNHQYVVSSINMPTNATEARMLGIDLDDDPQGRPDNALGNILSTLASQAGEDFDLQESIDEQVRTGNIILLANLKASALSTATGVGAWVFLGDSPSIEPCVDAQDTTCARHLDGSTMFNIAADSPSADNVLISGDVIAGQFRGGPGKVTIEIALVAGEDTGIVVDLVGARMEINSVADGSLTNAKLGGAVTEESLNDEILPALHGILSDSIAADCMGTTDPCCEPDSTGELLVNLFDQDTPKDCKVTLEEIKTNNLIASLLAPDLDLFDGPASPTAPVAPRQDGVKDSLSIGIGFEAVGASFTNPAGVD